MKKGIMNYLFMAITFTAFAIGALDSFGFYRIDALQTALSIPSFLVIIGGSLFQAFSAFSSAHVFQTLKELKPTFSMKPAKSREEAMIEEVMVLVRGLKASRLETINRLLDGKTKGFRLYVAELLSTNYNTDEIRILGNHKIRTMKQSEMVLVQVAQALSAASPAYGMIGTLMGLIVMLGNFEDASGLALGLSLALMTTFYGLLLAQFLWMPLIKKLQQALVDNQIRRQVELEGVLLSLENKPELFIVDQLSAMVQARESTSTQSAA
jgi:chemotaxis protein MotA